MRPKLSYANVMATIAVFIALGGASYAAFKLPKNSVGAKQIRKNAVNTAKVKNGSLLASDFKSGQLPAGPQGERGEKGEKGERGERGERGEKGESGTPATKLFASVRQNGTILHSSPGVTVGTYGGPGEYFATFPQDVTDCVAIGSIGETSSNGIAPGEITTRTDGNAAPEYGNRVDIITFNSSGAYADEAFNLAVFC
jgi:hypothetical protein